MSIEAMKQWLEALEYPLNTNHEAFDVDMAELLAHRAIESLKKYIAEAEKQEPDYLTIAYMCGFEAGRQQGIKQERALWELARIGQEIEAEAEKQEPVCAMCKSTHGKWSWMCGRCLLIHDKQPTAHGIKEKNT